MMSKRSGMRFIVVIICARTLLGGGSVQLEEWLESARNAQASPQDLSSRVQAWLTDSDAEARRGSEGAKDRQYEDENNVWLAARSPSIDSDDYGNAGSPLETIEAIEREHSQHVGTVEKLRAYLQGASRTSAEQAGTLLEALQWLDGYCEQASMLARRNVLESKMAVSGINLASEYAGRQVSESSRVVPNSHVGKKIWRASLAKKNKSHLGSLIGCFSGKTAHQAQVMAEKAEQSNYGFKELTSPQAEAPLVLQGLRTCLIAFSAVELGKTNLPTSIKVLCEKAALQVISFMYRTHLTGMNEIKQLFSDAAMLKVLGQHIGTVFKDGIGLDIEGRMTFQPELDYILVIAKETVHLQHFLAVLDKAQQLSIIHKAWIAAYKLSQKRQDWQRITRGLHEITTFLNQENFSEALSAWTPIRVTSSDCGTTNQISAHVIKLIKNFMNSADSHLASSVSVLDKAYMLNYIMLDFIILNLRDQNSLKDIFDIPEEYQDFHLMFEIMSAGRKASWWLSRLENDTMNPGPSSTVSQHVSEDQVRKNLIVSAERYCQLNKEVEDRTQSSLAIRQWKRSEAVNSILTLYRFLYRCN